MPDFSLKKNTSGVLLFQNDLELGTLPKLWGHIGCIYYYYCNDLPHIILAAPSEFVSSSIPS